MKKKKIVISISIIIVLLGMGCYFLYQKLQSNKADGQITEYIPEEEITQEQLRQTIVSLYFNNKDTGSLVPEARAVDVKELTKEPYQCLIHLLMEGPKNEKLEKTIPEGTKVNKVELKDNTVIIDFSKEFIQNHKGGAEEEGKTIYAIVNTLTQLNEVEAVKIKIDGKEDSCFPDNALQLKDAFVRKD